MQKDFVAMSHGVEAGAKSLSKQAPELMKAFRQLTATASASGALDAKTKELMAVAISITTNCDGCIAYHMKAALKGGATREEVVETIGVAIEMGGGPAMVYGASALEAYEQFLQAGFSSAKVG